MDTSGDVTVSKRDKQTYTSEFESHWVPHSLGLVPNRSNELRKLLLPLYSTFSELEYMQNVLKNIQNEDVSTEKEMKNEWKGSFKITPVTFNLRVPVSFPLVEVDLKLFF